jgi:DNA-binding MarR family transcriptional regulator
MLSYPPRRMMDVWSDPDYRGALTRAEVLLMAALDYSPEKHIVYVAARPPRSIFKQMASRIGRKIVYIPLGSLSPLKLKQLRVLHILAGKDKRGIAREYIW